MIDGLSYIDVNFASGITGKIGPLSTSDLWENLMVGLSSVIGCQPLVVSSRGGIEGCRRSE